MLTHIVLFFLVEGIDPADPRVARACQVESDLGAAAAEVDGTWAFGPGASNRAAAAHFVAIGRFPSHEELGRFLAHQAHTTAVRAWEGLAEVVVGDLPTPVEKL